MARLVEVGESRFGGKGLMSRRDFEAGDVVLVESPFLTVCGAPAEPGLFLCRRANCMLSESPFPTAVLPGLFLCRRAHCSRACVCVLVLVRHRAHALGGSSR
jgi:hypothetical protein